MEDLMQPLIAEQLLFMIMDTTIDLISINNKGETLGQNLYQLNKDIQIM